MGSSHLRHRLPKQSKDGKLIVTELYYLGIIKGYLHSKGEEAHPVKIWHAVKALGDVLKAPRIIPEDKQAITEKEMELPPLTRRDTGESPARGEV